MTKIDAEVIKFVAETCGCNYHGIYRGRSHFEGIAVSGDLQHLSQFLMALGHDRPEYTPPTHFDALGLDQLYAWHKRVLAGGWEEVSSTDDDYDADKEDEEE